MDDVRGIISFKSIYFKFITCVTWPQYSTCGVNHKGWCNDFHGLYQHYFLTVQSLARPWQDWGSERSARKERSFVASLTCYLAVVPVFSLLRLSSRKLIVELEPVRWWPRYCIRSSPNITPSGLLASPGHTRWPWRYGRGPVAMEFCSLSTYLRSLSTYAHSLPTFNRDVLWGFRSDLAYMSLV